MPVTVVLHIGMHKTGSSSIQETFARAPLQNAVYAMPDPPNHSGILSQGYETDLGLRKLFHPNAPQVSTAARNAVRNQLKMARSAPGVQTVIVSAERLSVMSPEALQDLRADLCDIFDDIRVIGYVRPVAGMMASSFQQILKHGHASFETGAKCPQYRARFEKFDTIFGPDAVDLVLFDRATLRDGDAVKDFASRIGQHLRDTDVIQTNESLPLEGTALLYAHRKFVVGDGERRTNFVSRDQSLISFCNALGTGKFTFGAAIIAEASEKNSEDLHWICDRINTPFDRFCAPGAEGVTTEDELLSVIERPEIREAIRTGLKLPADAETPTARDLAQALEGLRDA